MKPKLKKPGPKKGSIKRRNAYRKRKAAKEGTETVAVTRGKKTSKHLNETLLQIQVERLENELSYIKKDRDLLARHLKALA